MGTTDTYAQRFSRDVAPPEFHTDAHYLVRQRSTHLFFEPGEAFSSGWSIYYVPLLVERLGVKAVFVDYAAEHIFAALERNGSASDGRPPFARRDETTAGVTCSISNIAKLFADIMSPDCRLLRRQDHRDIIFMPQLTPDSSAHQALLADASNYCFFLLLEEGVPEQVSWALSPPPNVNKTVVGALLEEDDALPGTCIPRGTVTFEGLPNIIWTMNRERGRMMLCGTQLLPDWDVEAHNLASRATLG